MTDLRERLIQTVHDWACGCSEPWPNRADYDELGDDLIAALDGFDTLVWAAKSILAVHYPPSVFTGESGEPGPKFIVALRDAVVALEEGHSAVPSTAAGYCVEPGCMGEAGHAGPHTSVDFRA